MRAKMSIACGPLTMRLSDVGRHRHQTKLIYPDHPPSPWLTEDAAPRSLEPIVRHPPLSLNFSNE
jgi:hypothetical protein